MFDPTSYRDIDFGLDPGESFEPEDAEETPPVDLSRPHVMTVLGPIDPEDLGICLSHAHVLGDPSASGGVAPESGPEESRDTAEHLETFLLSGGRSVVDAATADSGRDIWTLFTLAQHLPLHIIASTGGNILSKESDVIDPNPMSSDLVTELKVGIDGSPARAGIITIGGDPALGRDQLSGGLRVAAKAHLDTGAAISVALSGPLHMRDVLDVLGREGVGPDHVIFQHLDGESVDDLRAVTKVGAWCSFDRIGEGGSAADTERARCISSLFEAGHSDRILVSQGRAQEADPITRGVYGRFSYLLERFTLTLMDAGLTAAMVRSLLVDNPRRAITIVPAGSS